MDPDIALVIGLIIGGLAIPGILSALTERRAPRASMLTFLISAGLVYYALANKPGGYTLEDIPNAFIDVIAKVFL